MSLFHRHRWQEQERVFCPPPQPTLIVLMREYVFGVTVFRMKCLSCGDRKAVEMIGDHRFNQQNQSHAMCGVYSTTPLTKLTFCSQDRSNLFLVADRLAQS